MREFQSFDATTKKALIQLQMVRTAEAGPQMMTGVSRQAPTAEGSHSGMLVPDHTGLYICLIGAKAYKFGLKKKKKDSACYKLFKKKG